MLVKSQREEDRLKNLRETFDTLHSYNMKLNPSKCAFGVTAGKFLGFMVSQRGIEANPDKIQAIIEMTPPRNVKEAQSLNDKVATLNRFMSRKTNKVPTNRKSRLCFGYNSSQVEAILPSPHYRRPNRQTSITSNDQS